MAMSDSHVNHKGTDTSRSLLLGAATIVGAILLARIGVRAFGRVPLNNTPRHIRKFGNGGFESKMTRWEAAQIVGLNERSLTRAKLAEKYKSVMLANHPDRGGSPYLALKINEARRVLDPFARR